MSTNVKKRPLGLKAQQKRSGENQPKKARPTEQEDSSFTTVALLEKTDGTNEGLEDGLTLGDLLQLKTQAEELIDNPTEVEAERGQLVNLLRGICHEAIRQIELTEQQELPCIRLTHQLIAWASIELGVFLELGRNSDRFLQPDEPRSFDGWLSMASKVLDKLPTQDQTAHEHPDLELLPLAISLLKSESPVEIAASLGALFARQTAKETDVACCGYLLRTIDRLIVLKAEIIATDPTPIFEIVVGCLQTIRSNPGPGSAEKDQNVEGFQRLIDQRLADCYLTHGSLLVEQLENQYYTQDESESESDDEEEFRMDVESPTYKLSLERLKLAEQTFSNLLGGMDDSDECKELLKSKLDETLLTLGNLLPSGPEREELYLRAGLAQD